MIYLKDTDELNNNFNIIIKNPLTNDYPRFKVYVEGLFQRRQEWAICLRNKMVTRGQNTNNISEAGVKIMKDVVLERTKAYSPVQFFVFIINDENFMCCSSSVSKKKYFITNKQKKSLEYRALDLGNSFFFVKNQDKIYNIRYWYWYRFMFMSTGDTEEPCKYQIYIAKNLKIDLPLC